jgi:hypothetical protein
LTVSRGLQSARTTGSPALRLSRRDLVASAAVGAAAVVYALRALGAALPGHGSVRATATVVLALGFIASASAVVPTFDRLMHGNKLYLGATSLLGVLALAGGVQAIVARSAVGLTILFASMIVLWAVATGHHLSLARSVR